MVESAAHKSPVVDLDEFERRLRGPLSPVRTDADPLAELARLVNGEGNPARADVFSPRQEAPRSAPVVRLPTAAWDRAEAVAVSEAAAPHLRPTHDPLAETGPSLQETFEREMAALHRANAAAGAAMPAPANDEPGHAFSYPAAQGGAGDAYAPLPDAAVAAPADVDWADGAAAPVPRPKASNRPFYIMGAISAVAVALIGGSLALRANTAPGGRVAPVIKAADAPVKVAPPVSDAAAAPAQSATILDKSLGAKATAETGAAKLSNNAEQPVDLSQAATKLPSAAGSPTRAVTTAVAPPAPDVGPATGTANDPKLAKAVAPPSIFGEPKKVRTVSVKPDGSLVSEQTAAAAPAPQPPRLPQIAGLPVTAPSVAPPTPAAAKPAPKATVRVVPVAKPPAPKPAARAEAEAAAPDAADANAPLQLPSAPAKGGARVKLAKAIPAEAPAEPAAAPASGSGGGFAVQIAAPPSEQEARDAAARLRKQYSEVLGGHSPSIRKASSNGRDVYRVRINSLSREEAKALCDNLAAAGGKCFIARN